MSDPPQPHQPPSFAYSRVTNHGWSKGVTSSPPTTLASTRPPLEEEAVAHQTGNSGGDGGECGCGCGVGGGYGASGGGGLGASATIKVSSAEYPVGIVSPCTPNPGASHSAEFQPSPKAL